MDIPETRYARSHDGAFIAYQVFGQGDLDLLWISPWFAHLEMVWEYPPIAKFHRAMTRFARVITMDQRGVGLSDKTKGLPDLETRMDDVRAVLDAAGSERTILWGAGADGGALCSMYAATYPDRVVALAFWSAAATGLEQDEEPENEALNAALERGWGLEEHTAEILRLIAAPSMAEDPETVRWTAKVFRHMGSPGDVLAFNQMYAEIDYRSILPAIHVPTLVMYRDYDGLNEPFAYLASHIPGATAIVLPEDRDFPPWLGDTDAALAELEGFLNSVRREEAEMNRVLATVLFTDIVDSTATAAVMGDTKWREMVIEHDSLAKAIVGRYRGEFVRGTGDGMLATFDGPARAVRCAQTFVDSAKALGLEIRAGAHTGEITYGGNDLAGIGVHVAARVASMAGPSEVWASSTVKDLTAGSGLTFEDAGEHELKGVPDSWHLYRVVG